MGMGKRVLLILVLLCFAAGCQAEIAGPIPDYHGQQTYTSPHRRIPQSEHSLTGVISDVHLEILKSSERLHIGNRSDSNNNSLPAFEITCSEEELRVRVYARHVQSSLWQDKLKDFASQSQLVSAMSWHKEADKLYTEYILKLNQPVQYRSWYYVDACFFTIEFTAKTTN